MRLADTKVRPGGLCVCVDKATVIRDDRKATPYEVKDCVVGVVDRVDDEGFVLAGWSFATHVRWEDVRAWWPRSEAPDPCPICGTFDGAARHRPILQRGGS